ncbi:hypothetical protein [Chryseobacterium oryctis]|uniref:Uncharacterized protein n=1 Tax=Chryseobacterium oryctis TaxID=2952618 RepID=A0ABT3HNE9_9FLAO|nr:hypothetical protein [Chryseobacterium oryctis]MCW3161319.1 hypothetical protein [Chryseobacterium oryctis]
MKKILFFSLILNSLHIYSQVGINTESPKATLDVVGKPTQPDVLDGIIIPRITGNQLSAKTYTTEQTGTILYVRNAASSLAGQVINVDAAGFYYFDGNKWMKTGNSSSGVNIYNSNGALTGNREANLNGYNLNFSGNGNVGIGGIDDLAKLNVKGFIQFAGNSDYGVGKIFDNDNGEKYGLTQITYFPSTGDGRSPGTRIYTSGRTSVPGHIAFGKYTSASDFTEWARFAKNTGYFGINTYNPVTTMDVTAYASDATKADGITAPRLTGNQLKAKDALYGTNQQGAIIYATAAANPTTTKTANVTKEGYYYFNGSVWVAFQAQSSTSSDATRFLGGTVYSRFGNKNNGTLDDSKIIGGGESVSYSVGGISHTSTKGGINSLKGNGYTISNPKNGIFDIQFDTPMSEIYGISVNIVDSYGYNSGNQGGAGNNTTVNPSEPGSRLFTNDNSQVSFISDSIIRIKTGDSNGGLSNRSFTFLVTGK